MSQDRQDWIWWTGGPCPVGYDTEVEVYFVDGRHLVRSAGAFIKADTGEDWWEWRCRNERDRIDRYRITNP